MEPGARRRLKAYETVITKLGKSLRVSKKQPNCADIEAVCVPDDEAPAAPNLLSTESLAEALRITLSQAEGLFGADPMDAARAINKVRVEPGTGFDCWGRFRPGDRFSLDQVPCLLVDGDKRTYNFSGRDKHIWVAGSGKGDEGKRFCTLQLIVRCENGDPSKLYCGQPKPEVLFRGKGMKISAAERAAWHPEVHVGFQPKAWYDAVTCLQWAKQRTKELTVEARREGRESVISAENDLIGRQVMLVCKCPPLNKAESVWYLGSVAGRLTSKEQAENPGCNFWVSLRNDPKGKVASKRIAFGLTPETRERQGGWVPLNTAL